MLAWLQPSWVNGTLALYGTRLCMPCGRRNMPALLERARPFTQPVNGRREVARKEGTGEADHTGGKALKGLPWE